MMLSAMHGDKLKNKENTLVFIDEIEAYDHLLTLLKFLAQDNKYTYIASGSLLGVSLKETSSIPMGSIRKVRMFPLDLEEFLYANGVGKDTIEAMRLNFKNSLSLNEALHSRIVNLFKRYLLVGGMPDAVNAYLETRNIFNIRSIQNEIKEYYTIDAAKYDTAHRLKIMNIYNLIPSNMENKKKRITYTDIEDKKGKKHSDYVDEFDYLIASGIALDVKIISNLKYPLIQSTTKNLIKLYMNDVGLLSSVLYGNNIKAILEDIRSINLGSIYETVVAMELLAHGHDLYYYDNRTKGEVDFLINDHASLLAFAIQVKSGKDYSVHSAFNNLLKNEDYHINEALVLSNERIISHKNGITYSPIYNIMFIDDKESALEKLL